MIRRDICPGAEPEGKTAHISGRRTNLEDIQGVDMCSGAEKSDISAHSGLLSPQKPEKDTFDFCKANLSF